MTATLPAEPTPGAEAKYDRQLIVALLDGRNDAVIVAQAEALNGKQRTTALLSEVVSVRRTAAGGADAQDIEALRAALAGKQRVALPVRARSRLYLVGEGDAAQRLLAGWPSSTVAALLADAGLRDLGLISIVADGAGRDPDRGDAAQIEPQSTSFASLLHRALRDKHGITTTVNARVGAVKVVTGPMSPGGVESGRKLTSPQPGVDADTHHAPRSKLRLRWDGDGQVSEWSY